MSLTTTLDTMQVDRPDPAAAQLLPQLAGYMMGMMEMNADDPTEAYIEERMNMSSEDKAEVRRASRRWTSNSRALRRNVQE